MRTTFLFFAVHLLLTMVSHAQSFIDLSTPFSSTVRVLYMSNTNTLYAGGDIGFFRTTNLGQTWDTVLTENTRSIYIYNDSTWYLCTHSGIFKTNDSGEQWIPFGQSLPTSVVEDITINLSSNTFFAATSSGLYKSTDEGNNWINTLNCTTSDYTNIESINDTLIYLGKTNTTSYNDDLFLSFDNGNNWEIIDFGSLTARRMFKTPKNRLLLERRDPGSAKLYRSSNRGVNWYLVTPYRENDTGFGPWTAGINNSVIMQYHYWMNVGAYNVRLRVFFNNYQLEYSLWGAWEDNGLISSLTSNLNQELFAGLGDGKIRKISGITLTDITDERITTPKEFLLFQNFPNPFNPRTSIQYAIGSRQFVKLKVYDVLGNEVATIVNEYRDAGSYEIDFNASKISSGVYYYQLRAGSFVQTKKMIYLK